MELHLRAANFINKDPPLASTKEHSSLVAAAPQSAVLDSVVQASKANPQMGGSSAKLLIQVQVSLQNQDGQQQKQGPIQQILLPLPENTSPLPALLISPTGQQQKSVNTLFKDAMPSADAAATKTPRLANEMIIVEDEESQQQVTNSVIREETID
jgi:hypothetical protein